MDFQILPQREQDPAQFDALLDRTFGPERSFRTVYRLRENAEDLAHLRFVAAGPGGELIATLRFWPIVIEAVPAILLGPLAVEPDLQGRGIGKALLRHGLREARLSGHRICVVVGEPGYYRPYGFSSAGAAGLILPGPVDPVRFQVLELTPGALDGVRGMIGRATSSVGPVRAGVA